MKPIRIMLLTSIVIMLAVEVSAQGTWTTYINSNSMYDIAINGDNLWCATSGGVVKWNMQDITYEKFTTLNGLPSNVVNDITIAPDGTIWIGTTEGISRYYDGIWNTFTINGEQYKSSVFKITFGLSGEVWICSSNTIICYDGETFVSYDNDVIGRYGSFRTLAVAPDSTVWFGTTSGLIRYNKGTWETYYTEEDGPGTYEIRKVLVASDGSIWCGTPIFGLYRYKDGTWTLFGMNDWQTFNYVAALAVAPDGKIWVGGVYSGPPGGGILGGGVSCYNGETWENYNPVLGRQGYISPGSIVFGSDGALWLGTRDGLVHYDGENWTTYKTSDGLAYNYVFAIAVETNGAVWFGTYNAASRLDNSTWTTFSWENSQIPEIVTPPVSMTYPPNKVNSIIETKEGKVWFATEGGLRQYDNGVWTIYYKDDGIASSSVKSIALGVDNEIWFGTTEGISMYKNGSWTTFTTEDGLEEKIIRSVKVNNDGDVWAVFWHGAVSRYKEGNWEKISIGDGLEEILIYSIEFGPEGAVWLGSDGKIYKYEEEIWTTFTASDGLPSKIINTLTVSSNGDVWAGTYGSGICHFDGTSWAVFTQDDGLTGNSVRSIAIGPSGELWIGTTSGVSRYEPFSVLVEESDVLPYEIDIISNFPNPFNPSTTINYSIGKSGHITLEIFNILGQKVTTLFEGHKDAGTYSINWDASGQSNGLYFTVMKAGGITKTEKMMLMK